MSKNKFSVNGKKNKQNKNTKHYDPDDVDFSLRFKEEKKRQKPNNWKKYLERVEEDEEQYG